MALLVGLVPGLTHASVVGAASERLQESDPVAVTSIASGSDHACAIVTGGVKCWGRNSEGQLGLGDTSGRGDGPDEMGDALPFVDLGTTHTATSLAAGSFHSCALLDDGTVKCWGGNERGQLGLGDTTTRGDGTDEMGDALPTVDLGTGRTATAIAAGGRTTCALLDDATVKCWGQNTFGQLGLGNTDDRGDEPEEMGDSLPPLELGLNRSAIAIAPGGAHTCALLDHGAVKCWGLNDIGQLGLGDLSWRGNNAGEMADDLPAVDLGTGRTAMALTVGDSHSCALLDDSTVKCWGGGFNGQLGLGEMMHRGSQPGHMGDDLLAVELGTGRTALAVTAGSQHTCAILDDGSSKCWGVGTSGQLGLGDATNRGDEVGEMGDTLPVTPLGTGRSPLVVAAGSGFTCAALDDERVKCWGSSFYGELGLGDRTTRGDGAGEMGDDLPAVELGTILLRPDLTVRRSGGPTVGDGVVNTHGSNQTANAGRNRGGAVTFFATVTNEGHVAEAFNLRRRSSPPGLTVRYFKGRTGLDITAAIVNRTYTTRTLPAGASATIRVAVTVRSTARPGRAHDVILRARSVTDPARSDTVIARVNVP